MKTVLQPLRMVPFLSERVWGGGRLAAYGKKLPPGGHIGESWEISGHREGLSRVASGPLAGRTIPELIAEFGADLVGTSVAIDRPFPLLVKLIDARERLSVQVHPSDAYCAEHGLADPGKPESWLILEAAPGARIWRALERGTGRADFERLLAAGRLEECLHSFPVAAGDCIDLPAGTVHAIGDGIVLAEVQQTSDLTYRVFDWNRPGLDGRPRQLHVREALETIDWATCGGLDSGDKVSVPREKTSWGVRRRLAANDKFEMELLEPAGECPIAGDGRRFACVICTEGRGQLVWPGGAEPAGRGTSFLLPAGLEGVRVMPDAGCSLLVTRPALPRENVRQG
jgi:mannose-6-phosphate isomerase